MGTGEQRCPRLNNGGWIRWGCREGKGVVRSHIVDPGFPCSFSEGMLPAGRVPATYESGPGVGFCTDAAVDHGYQPVKQPVGQEEERTLVREVRLSLRTRKIAAPARVPHPGEPDRSRAKSFPLVSSPAYLDLLQMWAMVMHIPRYT